MPVYDPDAVRIAPESDIERLAPHVIHAANALLRRAITADEWEREIEELRRSNGNKS